MRDRLILTLKISVSTLLFMGVLLGFTYVLSLLPLKVAMWIFGSIVVCGVVIAAWISAGR